jgi:hypothetical protein
MVVHKGNIFKVAFVYSQRNQLHDPNQGWRIKLNQQLKYAFSVDEITYEDIPRLLTSHLGPPDPIQISYPITYASSLLI